MYGAAGGGLTANGLAYIALFAAVPTGLLILGLAGYVTTDPEIQANLAARLADVFPPLADVFEDLVRSMSQGAGITSLVGLVGLVWAVSQLYVALDRVFARIFKDEPARGVAGRQLRAIISVGILVLLVFVSLVLASVASVATTFLPNAFPGFESFLEVIGSPLALVASAVAVVLVGYRLLPPRPPTWRAIRVPGLLAALAVVVLAQGFAFVVPRLFGAATLASSLATAFIALAWLSLTFQVLLIGASWVYVRTIRADVERERDLPGLA
ncbi:MAG: YihY/virulence factor BrkB family protein [Chloroflexota bacterium]